MRRKRTLAALAVILLAVTIVGVLHRVRTTSLEARIRAAASRFKTYDPETAPPGFEQDVIALARESTPDLEAAFRRLDAEREEEEVPTPSFLDKGLRWLGIKPSPRPGRPPEDRVWLTGICITILAFDCPPLSARDWPTWLTLKGRFIPPELVSGSGPISLKQTPAINEMLAKWPWSHEGGSWHLLSVAATHWGSSDGRIAPMIEYYETHFKRRSLP